MNNSSDLVLCREKKTFNQIKQELTYSRKYSDGTLSFIQVPVYQWVHCNK